MPKPAGTFKSSSTSSRRARKVGRQIDKLCKLALKKVFAAMANAVVLTEQTEEDRPRHRREVHVVKDDPASLLDLDRELGARPAAAPPPAAE
jgi:hypothetical protein